MHAAIVVVVLYLLVLEVVCMLLQLNRIVERNISSRKAEFSLRFYISLELAAGEGGDDNKRFQILFENVLVCCGGADVIVPKWRAER